MIGKEAQVLQVVLLPGQVIRTAEQFISYHSNNITITRPPIMGIIFSNFQAIRRDNFAKVKNKSSSPGYLGISRGINGKVIAIKPDNFGEFLIVKAQSLLAYDKNIKLSLLQPHNKLPLL